MKKLIILFLVIISSLTLFANNKFGKFLKNAVSESQNRDKVWITWIYFTDKGNKNINQISPLELISEKSYQRRLRVNPAQPIDFYDLPIEKNYVEIVKPYLQKLRHYSRWLNAISAEVKQSDLENIAKLPFVKEIELIERFKKDYSKEKSEISTDPTNSILDLNYGSSLTQNQQINVPAVHNTGNYAQGITICVLDAGFNRLSHESFANMTILATYDFVNHRPYVGDGQGGQGSGTHGTQTLSTIGGYKPGQLIGPAFGAKYLLAKTENTDSETPIEMDNWIAGVEWADSIGVDVTSTSLGYLTFDPPYPSYTWQDMNGRTAVISRAATIAARKGIVVVNSAGNDGYHATQNTLSAPADADSILTVGSVTSAGVRSSFSSVGNTVDGRIKPDVMAMGSSTRVASPYSDNTYTNASGTSFSCPLAAGVAALVLAENPYLTPMQVINAMRNTSNNAAEPNREYGWGILNALAATNYFNIKFTHTLQYDSNSTTGPYTFRLKLNSRLPIKENKVILYWIKGTQKDSIYMTAVAPDSFIASINGDGTPGTYKYYFYAETATFNVYKFNPNYAPEKFYSFNIVGQSVNSQFSTLQDWNLVSVPVSVTNYSKSVLFPTAISSAYYYNNGYLSTENLTMGTGYWLKFPSPQSHTINGLLVKNISIPIKEGWNLIGSLHDTINTNTITTIPNGLLQSLFFGYDGSYFITDKIIRGKAYWVKSSGVGNLILNANNMKINSNNSLQAEELDRLTFISNNEEKSYLYFSKNLSIETPPLPQNKINKVIFDNNLIISDKPIEFVNLSDNIKEIELVSPNGNSFNVYDYYSDNLLGTLSNNNKIKINGTNKLKIVKTEIITADFKIGQNYPNPFNPSTKIDYQIPELTKVQIKIFDALGRELETLIDKEMEAGKYSINFDGSNYSSGIYFYELRAGNFRDIKRMILIK